MERNIIFYLLIFAISLLVLVLEAYVFKFTGAFGLIICLGSVYFIVGSIIRMLRLRIDSELLDKLDILFVKE